MDGIGERTDVRGRGRIAWLCPTLLRGSGGHRTIFHCIRVMAERGFENHLYIERERKPGRDDERETRRLRERLREFYGPVAAQAWPGWRLRQKYDLLFATAWRTARPVADARQDCPKAYLVQDYEPLFMPAGDESLAAEQSYRLGLRPVAIGRWLPLKLEREFGVRAARFDFCADQSIYRPEAPSHEPAVCFVHQPEKYRRCPTLGLEALGLVKRLEPEARIVLFGSNKPVELDFEHENLGLIDTTECNWLYNRCAVGLCLSASNPSRIPFEMMAAGLPVVELHRESTVYDLPEGATLLAEGSPGALAWAVVSLLRDPARRARMSERGLEFMRGRDPASSDAQFAEAVEAILAGKEFAAPESQPLYSAPAALAEFDAASLAPGAAGKRHPWRAAARRAMYLAARAAQYVRSGR